MIRQARTGDIVLVKSREMTNRIQTLPWWLGGERVKTTENKILWPPLSATNLRLILYLLKGRAVLLF
jgi:hypothetical protein